MEYNIRPCKTLVILGSGVLANEALDYKGLSRVIEGFLLYKAELCRIIVCCGGSLWDDLPIAYSMKHMLILLGVPSEAIYTEAFSRNTFENLSFARKEFPDIFSGPVIVVSCRWHLKRVSRIAKKLGIKIFPHSVPQSESFPRLMVERIAFLFLLVREIYASLYFRLRGWT